MDRKSLGAAPTEFFWRIDQWFPELGADKLGKLKLIHEQFLKANKVLNLVSSKTLPMADAIHFADSVIASRVIYASAKITELYDIGVGNGFPGLVFSALYPEIPIKMIELDERKSEFLSRTAHSLDLKNIEVIKKSLASLPDKSVQFAVSRGYAPIPKAVLATRKCFIKGGSYFHMKGEEWAREVADIPSQLCSHWLPHLVGEYKLPIGAMKFAVVATKKIAD